MLFDCLLVHQVVRQNPAAAVRGPKLSVTEGKTPNLPAEEVAVLIESIPTDTLVGLRLLPGGIRTARGKTGELTENRVDATESDFPMSYLSDNALSLSDRVFISYAREDEKFVLRL